MANRSQDWLKQAEHDLKHAQLSLREGDYEWACFASQQAAEKAVKALHLHLGQEAWGHVPVEVSNDLVEKARVLDAYYIPARYPNGFPEGAPFEHFGKLQAEEAIKYAGEIIEFVRSKMGSQGGGS